MAQNGPRMAEKGVGWGRKSTAEPVKVGIPRDLDAALSHIDTNERGTFVLPAMAELYLDTSRRDRISRMVSAHFEGCGIQTTRPGTGRYRDPETGSWVDTGKRAITDYGFHSLRYSYVSHHAEAGTPQGVIQANVGHSSPAMTAHYTRISDKAALQHASVLQLPISADRDGGERAQVTTGVSWVAREPLPGWARDLIEGITAENALGVRETLLKEEPK